jgi:pteridine reductase
VAIFDLDAEAAAGAAADLGSDNIGLACDVRDPARCKTAVAEVIKRLGRVDILVNSAAIYERAPLAATSLDLWERAVALNQRAPFFLCQEFAAQTERGAIINIADWRGERPDADALAYSMTKSALISLTLGLAKSLAPNIRVNAVAPGAILPPAGANPADHQGAQERPPRVEYGTPEDVVRAVIFLLESPYITGEILHVTHGQHL